MTGWSSAISRRSRIADVISLSARWWTTSRGVHSPSPAGRASSSASVMPARASTHGRVAGAIPLDQRGAADGIGRSVMRALRGSPARSSRPAAVKDRAGGLGPGSRRYTPLDERAFGAVGWRAPFVAWSRGIVRRRHRGPVPRRCPARRRPRRRARDRDHGRGVRPRRAHGLRRRAGDLDEPDDPDPEHRRAESGSSTAGPIGPGESYGHVFEQPGGWPYVVPGDPDLQGTVRALDAPETASAGSPEITPPPGHAAAGLQPRGAVGCRRPWRRRRRRSSPHRRRAPSSSTPSGGGGNGAALFLAVAVVGVIAVIAAIAGLIGASRRPGR